MKTFFNRIKRSMTKWVMLLSLILLTSLVQSCSYFSQEDEVVEVATITCNDSLANTTLMVTNQSNDSVVVWLTISIYTDSIAQYYVQDVSGIFGIVGSGGSGSFVLAPNDTLSYTSTLALSGNLCFGGQPINCPNTQFPTGTNIFEFTLNNCDLGTANVESTEISCVNGVNAFLVGNLYGTNWVATAGYDSILTFRNARFGKNTGLVGVFPTGCTNCTNQNGATTCTQPPLPFDQPNTLPICIISRPSTQNGGNVICTFKGFTPQDLK